MIPLTKAMVIQMKTLVAHQSWKTLNHLASNQTCLWVLHSSSSSTSTSCEQDDISKIGVSFGTSFILTFRGGEKVDISRTCSSTYSISIYIHDEDNISKVGLCVEASPFSFSINIKDVIFEKTWVRLMELAGN